MKCASCFPEHLDCTGSNHSFRNDSQRSPRMPTWSPVSVETAQEEGGQAKATRGCELCLVGFTKQYLLSLSPSLASRC